MPPKKDEAAPVKKKKEPPKELCGCGVDTYRPPPKGKKKKNQLPIEHAPGCPYQRTVCTAYPYLPLCSVCLNPCKYCLGTNRWCPHCYEKRCINVYKRVVHGHERLDPQRSASTLGMVPDPSVGMLDSRSRPPKSSSPRELRADRSS
ncbi:uncharacterized protein TEOVI_000741800 [Trypanosoma equiperdum]|uniref:Uncharacterized protein n=2 Tax=Trypanozoon TaxID=39700 RepID=Q389W9_TRYB2|nr:hypothetical protein, conserved [Trypanosoma brucei brucei TREU927]EAN78401.1 hypothetical protein, conserved [Trypanosoma brucei brucei TREU927]SCU67991.1 hypothetical protein, conserved [Trypanosoma equiperdum]